MNTTLAELLEKYKKGILTPNEWLLLREAVQSGQFEAPIQNDILQLLQNGAPAATFHSAEAEAILQKILATPAETPVVHRIHLLRRAWVRYAAAVIILLGAATYSWLHKNKADNTAVATPKSIKAARNGALLTLSDGSTIALDSVKDRTVAAQAGAQVLLKNGQLVYNATDEKAAEILYNTVTTTKGNQFHIQLPDGTTVYLNAGSSLRYPTQFAGNERRVEVSGEAYFEVAKKINQPFTVSIDKAAQVEVLGTSFNVNAYKDEKSITATLVEGSIRVIKGDEAMLVKPGGQAQIGKGIKIIPDADIDKALAWKNGLFNFEDVDLREMMRQLERWYDIEVVYEPNVPDIKFFGKISRKVDLATVLEALKGFGLHYEMKENRKLIVMK